MAKDRLSDVCPSAKGWAFGPKAVQDEPELAKWITNILVTWPHVESQLGFALANLLGTEAHIGVAIFNSITSTAAQRDMLEGAAKVAMVGDGDLPIFLAILDAVKSVTKERNPIAHEIWGSSPDVPGALLCLNAKSQLARRGIAMRRWLSSDTLTNQPELPDLDYTQVKVYREQDFKNILQEMHDLTQYFVSFWKMRDGLPPGRGEPLAGLENAPLLRERIRRRREKAQNAQKSPPPVQPHSMPAAERDSNG